MADHWFPGVRGSREVEGGKPRGKKGAAGWGLGGPQREAGRGDREGRGDDGAPLTMASGLSRPSGMLGFGRAASSSFSSLSSSSPVGAAGEGPQTTRQGRWSGPRRRAGARPHPACPMRPRASSPSPKQEESPS